MNPLQIYLVTLKHRWHHNTWWCRSIPNLDGSQDPSIFALGCGYQIAFLDLIYPGVRVSVQSNHLLPAKVYLQQEIASALHTDFGILQSFAYID